MVFYSMSVVSKATQQHVPMIQVADSLLHHVHLAHIWFEEAMHGDHAIDVNLQVYGPWPHTTYNKLVIYTFPTEQECVASIPSVKRKHRLFFKAVSCDRHRMVKSSGK